MDLVRLGRVFRAVRLRNRWRQVDVADRAGVSATSVGRAERGDADRLTVHALLAITTALGIRLDFEPRWRGGELDRLLSAGHSRMHEQIATLFATRPEWMLQPEVSFAIYAERGVIDILAFHPVSRSLLVIELKTEIVDIQAMIGTFDRYLRLAPRIAAERGWPAAHVSAWLVIRDTMANRRRVAAHAHVLRAAFPADGRAMRRWLRQPVSSIRALSFLSDRHPGNARGMTTGVRRVRRPRNRRLRAQRSALTPVNKP